MVAKTIITATGQGQKAVICSRAPLNVETHTMLTKLGVRGYTRAQRCFPVVRLKITAICPWPTAGDC